VLEVHLQLRSVLGNRDARFEVGTVSWAGAGGLLALDVEVGGCLREIGGDGAKIRGGENRDEGGGWDAEVDEVDRRNIIRGFCGWDASEIVWLSLRAVPVGG
jgi:hypothetical protein